MGNVREVLFETDAQVSGFHFDQWYDQESFMIGLQANFAKTADLDAVLLPAGNIERKNEQTYSDDGCTQVATMTVGCGGQGRCDRTKPGPVKTLPHLPGSGTAGQPVCIPYRRQRDTGIQAGVSRGRHLEDRSSKKDQGLSGVSPVRTGYGS